MHRRQVHNVEAEIGNARQLCSRLGERAAAAGGGPGRSRKHLVPRTKPRALAIHPDPQRHADGRARPIPIPRHARQQRVVQRQLQALTGGRRVGNGVRSPEQPVPVLTRGSFVAGLFVGRQPPCALCANGAKLDTGVLFDIPPALPMLRLRFGQVTQDVLLP